MKTIDDYIKESISYRKILNKIRRDDNVREVYEKYPDLAKIDEEIIASRKDVMIRILRKENRSENEFEREDKLLLKREDFIREHGIDSNFDSPCVTCNLCKDIGYVLNEKGSKRVCSCMNQEYEECVLASGMQDYESIRLEGYSKSKSSSRIREAVKKEICDLLAAEASDRATSICIYSDYASSGKTYLAICLCKLAIMTCRSAYYCKAESLGNFSDDGYYGLMDSCKNCDMLIVDDFSSDVAKLFKTASALSELLEIRNMKGALTILVTREPVSELRDDIDYRIEGKLRSARVLGDIK